MRDRHRERGLAAAGGFIVVAGLFLWLGVTIAGHLRPETLRPVGEPGDVIEFAEFVALEIQVFELEGQVSEIVTALKVLGDRVAAVEDRTEAIEARVEDAIGASVPAINLRPATEPMPRANGASAKAHKRQVRRSGHRDRVHSTWRCPTLAALTYWRP